MNETKKTVEEKKLLISETIINGVLGYLSTKPYREVTQILEAVSEDLSKNNAGLKVVKKPEEKKEKTNEK